MPDDRIIKIDTKSTSLVLDACGENVALLHYGKRIADADEYSGISLNPFAPGFGASNDHYMMTNMTYSSVGDGNAMEPLVEITNADGSRVNRFAYVGHMIVNGGEDLLSLPHARGGERTLIIEFRDETAKITLRQFYTVFSDCDVIAVRQQIVNNGKSDIHVNRLMSVQLDINGVGHKCVSFHGAWWRERYRKEVTVTAGEYKLQSYGGMSSCMINPFFMLKKADKRGCYAFNLIYSGNHAEIVEAHTATDSTRILVGLNDYCFDWTLKSGEMFETPQAVMLYAADEDEVTTQMHTFVMKHVVDPEFAYKDRPVLFNNWEGTYFDFNSDKIVAIAEKAKNVGAELFVLDDGWFGERNDDRRGLGDWFDNKEKLGGGLRELSDRIRALGLEFGIWVEPEMINEDSALYRAHPEFAIKINGRDPIRRRNQLVLDLVNPTVQEYLIGVIGDVIDRCKASYVKWDCNRFMTDMFSASIDNQGEYFHRYELALYRIIAEIKARFPSVLFESCSSGGNRYDLGMIYYMPQTWCSDQTEASHRVFIQEGTLCGYPQSTMGAHVSAWSNCSYESKFNVACIGAFGYELDPTKWNNADEELIKQQIAFYKKHRHLLQYGQYHRLESVFDEAARSSWMVIAPDKSEAMVFICETKELLNSGSTKWRLSEFDDEAVYSVEVRRQRGLKDSAELKYDTRGDVLNNCELDFGRLFDGETDRGACTVPLSTRLIYIKRR